MNELAIPYDSRELIESGRAEIIAHKKDAIWRINENAKAITANNYRTERLNAFDAEEKAIRAATDALVERVALATHCKELLVELAAAKNEVGAAIKARQEIIRKLKAENETPDPTHTYILQMDVSDAVLKKVVAVLDKCESRYRVAQATKDKDMKWAERFFAEMI